ncbi:MAG: hypothetical protein P4L51_29510 [Puia sp.]|nr:hypothetical protein [Puia sp.]
MRTAVTFYCGDGAHLQPASASFVLASIAIWFDFDYQALFAAGAIFISYIIPGHLFRIRNAKASKLSVGLS